MVRGDAGIEHRDGLAAAVVAGEVDDVGLDERDALGQHREREAVFFDRAHEGGAFQRCEAVRVDVHGNVGNRFEGAQHPSSGARECAREPAAAGGDARPLTRDGRAGKQPLGFDRLVDPHQHPYGALALRPLRDPHGNLRGKRRRRGDRERQRDDMA